MSAPCNSLNNAGANVSVIKEDLPEPETPVTAIIQPNGMLTSKSARLFCRAPNIVNCLSSEGSTLSLGRGISLRPDK